MLNQRYLLMKSVKRGIINRIKKCLNSFIKIDRVHPVSVATRLWEGAFLVNYLKNQRQEGKGQLT